MKSVIVAQNRICYYVVLHHTFSTEVQLVKVYFILEKMSFCLNIPKNVTVISYEEKRANIDQNLISLLAETF